MDSTAKRSLLAAYSRLLRPLIKILIRNGVSFSELSEVAKETYVHVASTDFKVPHRKMSQARIAILTGLTRKEVNRLTTKREGEEDQFHKNAKSCRQSTCWLAYRLRDLPELLSNVVYSKLALGGFPAVDCAFINTVDELHAGNHISELPEST